MNGNGPVLVPRPREFCPGTGRVVLGKAVKLATHGLSEGRVQVVEELLARAGVRLVERGDFTLEVEVGTGWGAKISSAVIEEYYELELGPGIACIRAAGEPGALWGVHTLIGLYRAADRGASIPALAIRDWPALASRGIFVENKWGPDRMTLADWRLVVDRLATLKMNRLGIGLYGCWGNCRYEPGPQGLGWPTEFLMVPVPGHGQLQSPKRLRWYSPQADQWCDETYLPRIFTEDFLGKVVAYGRERGVTVIPFVNSLGHNTLIPRLLPEISAKDEDGRSLGLGYCLSSPQTREFIEGFYGSVVERYFAGRAEFFHIQMDEVWADHPDPEAPQKRVEPWCRCPQCRTWQREELLQEYVVWLVEMLTRKGVDKVVMWNDQFTRHMEALDERFLGKLRERGLAERLILHWWWYSNEELDDKTRVAIGRQAGLPGWVAPMTCYFNWQMYSPRLKNIERMLAMARDEGGEGAVAYAVHDPGWTDHEMLLADYAWNPEAAGGWEEELEYWARGCFGEEAPAFLKALADLRQAAATPAVGRCYYYTYTYVRPPAPFPRKYPGEALESLSTVQEAVEQLWEVAETAGRVESEFARLNVEREGLDQEMLTSLQAEAARLEGLAGTFAELLPIWQEVCQGRVSLQSCERGARLAGRLVRSMAVVQAGKPGWVAPATLQGLSVLLEFAEQLNAELAAVMAGWRRPEAIRWTVEKGDER